MFGSPRDSISPSLFLPRVKRSRFALPRRQSLANHVVTVAELTVELTSRADSQIQLMISAFTRLMIAEQQRLELAPAARKPPLTSANSLLCSGRNRLSRALVFSWFSFILVSPTGIFEKQLHDSIRDPGLFMNPDYS